LGYNRLIYTDLTGWFFARMWGECGDFTMTFGIEWIASMEITRV